MIKQCKARANHGVVFTHRYGLMSVVHGDVDLGSGVSDTQGEASVRKGSRQISCIVLVLIALIPMQERLNFMPNLTNGFGTRVPNRTKTWRHNVHHDVGHIIRFCPNLKGGNNGRGNGGGNNITNLGLK